MLFRIVLEVRNESGSLHRHQSAQFHAVKVGELMAKSGLALWEAMGSFARFQSRKENDLKEQ